MSGRIKILLVHLVTCWNFEGDDELYEVYLFILLAWQNYVQSNNTSWYTKVLTDVYFTNLNYEQSLRRTIHRVDMMRSLGMNILCQKKGCFLLHANTISTMSRYPLFSWSEVPNNDFTVPTMSKYFKLNFFLFI